MDMTQSWYLMLLMALGLGVRHGFDLDHLATIDAISRTIRQNRILARCVGLLFSLGHGIIVTLVSFIIGTGIVQSHVPTWLEAFGNWVSIIFLFLFGILNLINVFQNPNKQDLPVGLKSFLAKLIARKEVRATTVLLIGALFALSFDTVSQIALFSISASVLAGWIFSLILGLTFTLGMILTDGLNGLFVSTLIQRSDRLSLIFSRSLGLSIALFSLSVGSYSLYQTLFP